MNGTVERVSTLREFHFHRNQENSQSYSGQDVFSKFSEGEEG